MRRVNFELHINDRLTNTREKIRIVHTIIAVAESLHSDTYAVLRIIDSQPNMLVECQHHLPAAAPFLRVYCHPMDQNAILELLKEKELHMDTEFMALSGFETATDMLPEGSFDNDSIFPDDRESEG